MDMPTERFDAYCRWVTPYLRGVELRQRVQAAQSTQFDKRDRRNLVRQLDKMVEGPREPMTTEKQKDSWNLLRSFFGGASRG